MESQSHEAVSFGSDARLVRRCAKAACGWIAVILIGISFAPEGCANEASGDRAVVDRLRSILERRREVAARAAMEAGQASERETGEAEQASAAEEAALELAEFERNLEKDRNRTFGEISAF